MPSSVLYRLTALALVVGGVIGVVASFLTPNTEDVRAQVASGRFYPVAIGLLVAGMLTVGAFPAVYLRQAGRSGVVGLVGMLFVYGSGMLIAVAGSLITFLILPAVAALPLSDHQLSQALAQFNIFYPAASIALAIGGILFGIATVRARVFSRWVGIGFAVAAVLVVVFGVLSLPGPLGDLSQAVINAALAWFGVELWRRTRTEQGPAAIQDPAPGPGPAFGPPEPTGSS